jgi:UDP-glucose 4-epimerase
MAMKILITGGLGNLGSWLTEYFVSKGYDVTTFSTNDRNVLKQLKVERVLGNIADENDVKELMKTKWDAIIHLASINEGNAPRYAKKALEINAWGARNLLQQMTEGINKSSHLLYFSTFHVYGTDAGVITENGTPLRPRHDYGTTHLFAEYYVQQFNISHGIPYTIFRLTNSYGCPREMNSSKWYLVLNGLARNAVEKRSITLNSNGLPLRDFIWMGDVAVAVDKCIEKGSANDMFNLGSGTSIKMIDVAQIVQQAYRDHFSELIEIKINEKDTKKYPDSLIVSVDKLKNWINFSPTEKMYEEAIRIFEFLKDK